jgi:hypothetical protein
MKINKNLRSVIKIIALIYIIFISTWGMVLPICLFIRGYYMYTLFTIAIGVVLGFIYDAIEKVELREKDVIEKVELREIAEVIRKNKIDWEFPWLKD